MATSSRSLGTASLSKCWDCPTACESLLHIRPERSCSAPEGRQHKHRDILRGRASWDKKANMIRVLIESQFAWTGGALHWSAEDLRQMNTLQLHVMRSSFRIGRLRGEPWADWNTRSMRLCRAWLVASGRKRWSSMVLTLQHTLVGHWARQTEVLRGGRCVVDCLPMRAIKWRCTEWWRAQQSLSRHTSVRHPGRVYISNVEQMLAAAHGNQWYLTALDRTSWTACRAEFVSRWDVRWCKGRQLSIQN